MSGRRGGEGERRGGREEGRARGGGREGVDAVPARTTLEVAAAAAR